VRESQLCDSKFRYVNSDLLSLVTKTEQTNVRATTGMTCSWQKPAECSFKVVLLGVVRSNESGADDICSQRSQPKKGKMTRTIKIMSRTRVTRSERDRGSMTLGNKPHYQRSLCQSRAERRVGESSFRGRADRTKERPVTR
jgi:hypothetical protein